MPWTDLSRQARQQQQQDNYVAAESLRLEALHSAEQQFGPNDVHLVPLLADLAISLHLLARDAEAEPLAQRAFAIAKESGDQRLIGVTLNSLGMVLSGENERARAEPVMRRSVALMQPDSLDFARASNNLAILYLETRQYGKAETAMKIALPIYEKRLGSMDWEFAMALSNMFTILAAQHRAAEGEPYLRQAIEIGKVAFPEGLKMANLQLCLASLEQSRENYNQAAVLLRNVIATQERVLGPRHPSLAQTLRGYSMVLRRMHQRTEAKNALNRANMILKSGLHDVK